MKYKLLDNKSFYNDLISEIENAKKFIVIESFIWVDDVIGNAVAKAVINASNRGIKVLIRNDISGFVYEHTPGRRPLLHDITDYKVNFLKSLYSKEWRIFTIQNLDRLGWFVTGCGKRPKITRNKTLKTIKSNKNIYLQNMPFFNHGKTIIIDGTLAYVGGQCISKDYVEWIDYAQKINDSKIVAKILKKLSGEKAFSNEPTKFIDNGFDNKATIHDFTKNFIRSTNDDLYIEMSYFGGWYSDALIEATKRGTHIYLILPEKADAYHDENIRCLSKLIKKANLNYFHISLHGFPNKSMIHTKGLVTKNKSLTGSNNMTVTGYPYALDEQNIYSEDLRIVKPILKRYKEDFEKGKKIKHIQDLPTYNFFLAMLNRFGFWMYSQIIRTNKSVIVKARKQAQEKLKDVLSNIESRSQAGP
jgi:phosphatidylserine/phosphatidylglycerophosphate/cardiolipin synthase-like enzyme